MKGGVSLGGVWKQGRWVDEGMGVPRKKNGEREGLTEEGCRGLGGGGEKRQRLKDAAKKGSGEGRRGEETGRARHGQESTTGRQQDTRRKINKAGGQEGEEEEARKGLRWKKRTKRGRGREHEERGRVASEIVRGDGSRGRVGVKDSLGK